MCCSSIGAKTIYYEKCALKQKCVNSKKKKEREKKWRWRERKMSKLLLFAS